MIIGVYHHSVPIYIYNYIYITYVYTYMILYMYMSNLQNPRFTERTSTNLGRSHRLPHVCTIMICGKLGGVSLAGNCYINVQFGYREGPIAYRVFLTISSNFHEPMSVQYIFSIAGVFAVACIYIYMILYVYTYVYIYIYIHMEVS